MVSRNIVISGFAVCVSSVACMATDSSLPNVIIITADDLGFQLSCYGDKNIKTKNIDRLASMGVVFDNSYVTQGSSSPSRSSILTGLYPHQNGHIGLAHQGFKMKNGLTLLPNHLKNIGYRTGIIGKLHVNDECNFNFDYVYKEKKAEPTREVVNVANAAENFMMDSDKPFFLYLNYFDPHTPLKSQVEGIPYKPFTVDCITPFAFQAGVSSSKHLQRIADYYSCVQRLDYGIGMLIDKLEKNNLLENTIIFFVSDNGINFTRGKTSCYEMGVKVPMIAVWGKHFIENSRTKALVSTVDIFPTICELIGDKTVIKNEGVSFSILLLDTQIEHRKYVFSEFTYHGRKAFYPRRAITDGRYKLIYNVLGDKIDNPVLRVDGDLSYDYAVDGNDEYAKDVFNNYRRPGKYELYDLESDPYEFNNLFNDKNMIPVRKKLLKELEDWMKRTEDIYSNESFSMSVYESILNE